MAKSLVISRLSVISDRLAKNGPYALGARFSLADTFLCFWVAYLDRDKVFSQLPPIAELYGLVRARPKAAALLEETEKASDSYARMMRENPGGVIR